MSNATLTFRLGFFYNKVEILEEKKILYFAYLTLVMYNLIPELKIFKNFEVNETWDDFFHVFFSPNKLDFDPLFEEN